MGADSVQIGASVTYDFRSADVQAYSANIFEVEPGVWALWSGDCADFGATLDSLTDLLSLATIARLRMILRTSLTVTIQQI